jgi:hypothetical protein
LSFYGSRSEKKLEMRCLVKIGEDRRNRCRAQTHFRWDGRLMAASALLLSKQQIRASTTLLCPSQKTGGRNSVLRVAHGSETIEELLSARDEGRKY